ncbi:4-(cytidine 5'-diphospho)-2-C-methyl-D-erythritol kinase [Paenochrobactrum sp. BZR 588]|uniref:4-(cytidine 5'-diphospho)-2-C-methyl-D-erythritol kinase n=1 Tax=unclassified Paenochrobactrum TaxID=2639760 RepID=UPI003853FB58
MTSYAPIADNATISRLAPVKINLALHVTGQRPNGYHELEMIVAFGDFGDRILVSPADHDDFTVSGYYAPLIPLNGDNLVLKARDLLRAQNPAKCRPVHIHLEKKLPIAAGIGGGSTDAAAALTTLNELWQLDLSDETLLALGLQLGADVPMCLHSQKSGAPLMVRGIGEELRPLNQFPALHILLINDGTALATPTVFKALKKRDNPPLPPPKVFQSSAEVCAYLRNTRNDLFKPAETLAPQLQSHLQELAALGADFVQMSGSGATCFAVFSNPDIMKKAKQAIRQAHPNWFAVTTQTYGSR